MGTWTRNIRYALRVLSRTPAFTLTIVATLAIVIGANATVFSLIDAVLLKPLPFPDAERLVLLSESREGTPISNTAPVRLEEWNEASSTLEAITGYYTEDVSETSGDLPERFRLARVAPRFHEVWGVAPALGRGLTPADSQVGASSVVLISDRFWRARLGADPNVTDRTLRLGDQEVAIVGVMPASFQFHDADVDMWAPRVFFPWMSNRNLLWYSAFARLEPGVTMEQAQADLELVQGRLAERYPETDRDVGIYLAPLKDNMVGGVRGSLFVVFGAVSVLLLIATTNIAALLLARAARRKQEIAVRLSLGASRGSVLAHSFTETAVLAVIGAALGLFIAARDLGGLACLGPGSAAHRGARIRRRRPAVYRRSGRRRDSAVRFATGDTRYANGDRRPPGRIAPHAGIGPAFSSVAVRRCAGDVGRRAACRLRAVDSQRPRAVARRPGVRAEPSVELSRERVV